MASTGKVVLLGAGPGDPGLITIKGLQAIKEADCIIYDRLSSPLLLEEAKFGCEFIYVGKASHNHTMKQEEINQILVEKAKEYPLTVRLKGGDAYVFGRGGEEGVELVKNQVDFEVIPGISSSIAGLTYAGIPITHRGIATGFHVVTAHNKKDELADLDFDALARGKETCVFLMGLSNVEEIAERLMKAGMEQDMPAAVISKATTMEQRTCVAPLKELAQKVQEAELESPALIVVGRVVSLREQLNFFETKPLFGKKCLVPRIEAERQESSLFRRGTKESELTQYLREQGADVTELPVGQIRVDANSLKEEQLISATWLIFTSRNGVEAFFENIKRMKIDLRRLSACKIASIGEKTSQVLKERGIYTDVEAAQPNSNSLINLLKQYVTKEDHVLYFKAKNADSHLKEAFDGVCQLEEVIVYENHEIEQEQVVKLQLDQYDAVFFSSASSVNRIIKLADNQIPKEWELKDCVFSIGPRTTNCLKKHGIFRVKESEKASYQAMGEQFVRMFY